MVSKALIPPLIERLIHVLKEIPDALTEVKREQYRTRRVEPEESETYRILISTGDKEQAKDKLALLWELLGPLSRDEYEKIDNEVRKYGTEALAWYRPFHYMPHEEWGIYIMSDGLKYLAEDLVRIMNINPWKAVWFSFQILWQHELFHAIVELYATLVEIHTLRPKYVPYMFDVYLKQWPDVLEEALANRHVYGRRDLAPIKGFMRLFFDKQPGAYRNYAEFLGRKFVDGRLTLCNYITGHTIPVDCLYTRFHGFSPKEIPTYLVVTKKLPEIPGLLYFRAKTRKAISLMRRKGCRMLRQTGDHQIWEAPNGKKIIIDVSRKHLHPKTEKDIMEALGLSREEFIKEI